MATIVTVLGSFYMLAAGFVLRRAWKDWLVDRAIEGRAESLPNRILFMAATAMLYGAAGLALLLSSRWAIYLLGGGMAVQAAFHALQWTRSGPQERDADTHRNKVWSAAIISTAAFAIAAYALRSGVLA